MRELFQRYKMLILTIIGVFLISFLGTAGVLWWKEQEAKPPVPSNQHLPNTPVAKADEEEPDTAITPQTYIIRRIVYLECGDAEIESAPASPEEIGLTAVEFGAQNPGWKINNFSKERVLITKEVEGLCKSHREESYLGIKNGYVAVYAGVPGLMKEIIIEVTAIPVNSLPEELQRQLAQGMNFHYYLGLRDGKVAIFFGTPIKKDLLLYKTTEYEAKVLPPQEVEDLKKYVLINSRQELHNVLESYAELTGDF